MEANLGQIDVVLGGILAAIARVTAGNAREPASGRGRISSRYQRVGTNEPNLVGLATDAEKVASCEAGHCFADRYDANLCAKILFASARMLKIALDRAAANLIEVGVVEFVVGC